MGLEEFEIPIGRRLGIVAKQFISVMYKTLSHIDIGTNFIVILLIYKTGGTLTQQELADECGLDKTNVLRIIDTLEEKGLLKRAPKLDDRRAYIIKLTPKGKKLIPVINKAIGDLNKKALDGISEGQQKSFFKTLDKISQNLNDLPAEKLLVSFNK